VKKLSLRIYNTPGVRENQETEMPRKWICTICKYIHEGDEPPGFCPICYASKNKFDPYVKAGEEPPDSR
jgi:rubrerythrin